MSELAQRKILIIDCQTTGMHPRNGDLLQLGWCIFDPQNAENSFIEKRTLKLPYPIPEHIKRLLQISKEDLERSSKPHLVFAELQGILHQLGHNPIILAHYAQFEKNFLKVFYKEQAHTDEFDFNLICSQQIAKRLLPQAPSHNLKALAGYLKLPNMPKNEVTSHVSMTKQIWRRLIPMLYENNITCYQSLGSWLTMKPKKQSHYEYNIDRLTRLELPEKPGIYQMLAEDGSILYVGKATSLKSRVNSYFRGIKNRDRRKLEMLAQVWSIDITECDTPLEASLLESDEIKKSNPPYNVLLKSEHRKILFYNGDFTQYAELKSPNFPNGPYKPSDAVMILIALLKTIRSNAAFTYFREPVPSELMMQSWSIFCETHQLESFDLEQNTRRALAIACKFLRNFEKTHGRESFQSWWIKEKKNNPEDELPLKEQIACKIERIFIRAAECIRKSRQLNRLRDASLKIRDTNKHLILKNGEIVKGNDSYYNVSNDFNIAHYDRLSILLTAKHKNLIVMV